jgi:hypothetical protein
MSEICMDGTPELLGSAFRPRENDFTVRGS